MKKKGFSLAELMIAMGVVGVVAAITIPMLVENAQRAQIGPKLAKAASALEQANHRMLSDLEATSLSESISWEGTYIEQISDYIKVTPYTYNVETKNTYAPGMRTFVKDYAFIAKDGTVYFISRGYNDMNSLDYTIPAHKRVAGSIFIDINGVSKPNNGGDDIFVFYLLDDGSLKPAGDPEFGDSWERFCKINQKPTIAPTFCTGHIFANNLKVLYKQ